MYTAYKGRLEGKDKLKKMHQAEYLDLPEELVNGSNGLSFDFGGSVIKILYRHRDQTLTPGEPPVRAGCKRVRLGWYSRSQLDGLIEDVQTKADITRNGDTPPAIHATGVGVSQYAPVMLEKLNIKLENAEEGDCFMKAFKQLCKWLPKRTLVEELNKDGIKEAKKMMGEMLDMEEVMKSTSEGIAADTSSITAKMADSPEEQDTSDLPYAEADENLYPCMLYFLGSAFGGMKLNKDGTCEEVETYNRGGRSFLGIGNLLTNTTTFDELINLAEKGSSFAVHTTTTDFALEAPQEAKPVDDIYAALDNMSETLIFCFGKSVYKSIDDFKAEDLARCLVETYATDVADYASLYGAASDVNNVFFVGNFPSSDVMRYEVTKHLYTRTLYMPVGYGLEKGMPNFYFLQHGGQLGAIGALLTSTEKPTPDS